MGKEVNCKNDVGQLLHEVHQLNICPGFEFDLILMHIKPNRTHIKMYLKLFSIKKNVYVDTYTLIY